MDNIFQQERNNAMLRKAIQDKEAPFKVAQTRLQGTRCEYKSQNSFFHITHLMQQFF